MKKGAVWHVNLDPAMGAEINRYPEKLDIQETPLKGR